MIRRKYSVFLRRGKTNTVTIPYDQGHRMRLYVMGEGSTDWELSNLSSTVVSDGYQFTFPADFTKKTFKLVCHREECMVYGDFIYTTKPRTVDEKIADAIANMNWPEGVQGPKGATGEQGLAGPQGEEGPAGESGPSGKEGPQGQPGPKGERGEKGEAGDTGPRGPQGFKGDPGTPGADGLQGEIGPNGAQGVPGPKGDPGPAGVKGDAGPQGQKGDTGPQGLKGDVGPQGPQGIKGDTGSSANVITQRKIVNIPAITVTVVSSTLDVTVTWDTPFPTNNYVILKPQVTSTNVLLIGKMDAKVKSQTTTGCVVTVTTTATLAISTATVEVVGIHS